MKRSQLGAFAAVACAMAVTLSAQQTPPPAGGSAGQPPTASSQPTQRSSEGGSVTVQGCLEKATPGPTGTSGAAAGAGSSSTSSAKFVLNNAAAAAGASSPTAGTSGSRPIASSYSLDGDDSKLTPHVGHKVEISGTVEGAGGASPSKEPGAAASASAGPKLKVSSVKMIASSCTP